MLGCMALAMGLVASCSGSDGERGLQGEPGADSTVPGPAGADGDDGIACWDSNGDGVGTDGSNDTPDEDLNDDGNFDALDCQGDDGANGEDGNANVRRIIFDTSLFSQIPGPLYTIQNEVTGSELTAEVLETHAFLIYGVAVGSGEQATRYIPLPSSFFDINAYVVSVRVEVGLVEFEFLAHPDWPDFFNEVHMILIEQSSSTDGGPAVEAKAQADIMASLKAAQVDVSNYHEVVKYLGIE